MSQRTKYVMDTSVLLESISQDGGTVIAKLSEHDIKPRYHLNHCLIEFRLGLLSSWISLYLDILATQDVKSAKRRVGSQINYKPREGSNFALLEALLSELFSSLEVGNPQLYLAQIEECISYAQMSLKLLSEKVVGSNPDHHLLQPAFIGVDDYEEFYRRSKGDYVVDISEIFRVKRSRFVELLDYLKQLKLSKAEQAKVNTMIVLIEQGLTDVKKVNMKSQNRRYGDIIIAMDTTSNYHLISKDDSFKVLCGGLNKNFLDYKSL